MAGLFWITPDTVHLGAPPGSGASSVALTAAGLTALGPQAGFLSWQDVRSVRVEDVPARTSARLSLARILEAVVGPRSPTEMTVRIAAGDGTRLTVPVHSAAASAYTAREAELSQRLLDRFAEGRSSPAVLMHWLTTTSASRPPRPAEREALLHRWTQDI
jgi:hypothetical protein